MTNDNKIELPATTLVTPEVRLSFPALFTPRPRVRGGTELFYQAVLLIPPGTDLKPFGAAVRAAMMEKWNKVIPLAPDKMPVRKAETKGHISGYEPGWFFTNVNSRRKVPVVDRMNVPVTDPNAAYPGMWVRAFLKAFAWDHPAGGRGVSFGLQAVQLVRDGERLDGTVDPQEVFTPLAPLDGEGEQQTTGPAAQAPADDGLPW